MLSVVPTLERISWRKRASRTSHFSNSKFQLRTYTEAISNDRELLSQKGINERRFITNAIEFQLILINKDVRRLAGVFGRFGQNVCWRMTSKMSQAYCHLKMTFLLWRLLTKYSELFATPWKWSEYLKEYSFAFVDWSTLWLTPRSFFRFDSIPY